MRFPWPFRTKSSTVNQVTLLGLNFPGPIEHVRYDVLSRETYERNITLYRAIHFVARAVASVPWLLYRTGSGSGTRATRHVTPGFAAKAMSYTGPNAWAVQKKLLDGATEVGTHKLLTLLENPSPGVGQSDYMEQMMSYTLISGNSFEEFVAPSSGVPRELYNLRPDLVKVIPNSRSNRAKYPVLASAVPDKSQLVLGYVYQSSTHHAQQFPADRMLHRKLFNPRNQWYGLSPLQVAMRSVRTDNKAADWQQALMDNEARPSGVLSTPTNMDQPTWERINTMITDSWTGAAAAGLPVLLEGDMKWQQLGLSPAELDFLESRKFNRVELAMVIGVAPELLGDPDHKTFNSFPEARRSTYQDTILPHLDRIRDAYNATLTPLFGDDLFLDYDRDQIHALQEEMAKVWERVGKATHISINEKREATGYGPYKGDPEIDPSADVPVGLMDDVAVLEDAPQPVNNDGEKKGLETKAQVLTRSQRRARSRLRTAFSDLFEDMGEAVAAHVQEDLT